MPEFLLTATDHSGRRETQTIEADSSRAACERLERLGYRDIALHTSDVEAAVLTTPSVPAPLTAADVQQIRTLSQFGFFCFVLRMMLRKCWFAIVMGVCLIGLDLWGNQRVGISGVLGIGLIASPAVLAFIAAYVGKSFKYKRFLEAASWGRWQEVLDQAPGLRGTIAAFDVAAREAGALAALGQLEEGLRRFGAQQTPDTPRWLYLSRLAEIYSVAKQYDRSLDFHRMAYDAAPHDATMQLGLAMELLKCEVEPQRAEELIEMAKQQPLSDLLLAVLPHVEGLLALNTGDFAAAKQFLLTAHERLQVYAAAQSVIGVVIDVNRAYLAIAMARLGDMAGARQQFELARPRLVALDSERLLKRTQKALAGV